MTEENNKKPSALPKKQSWGQFIRSCFFTGLLTIAPVFITVFILHWLVTALDSMMLGLIPDRFQPSFFGKDGIPGFGLLGGAFLVFLVGLCIRNYLGARLLEWGDQVMMSIPGVRSLYNAIKQVIDTLATSSSEAFHKVVLVEFPRKGMWTLAFVTSTTRGEVQEKTDDTVVTVYVPTTPNPTSGYLQFISSKDIIELDMTVEQGMKMLISGGIVGPEGAPAKVVDVTPKKPSRKKA